MIYARCCAKRQRSKDSSSQRLILCADTLTIAMLSMFVLNGVAAFIGGWREFVTPVLTIVNCNQWCIFQWITNQYSRALLYLVIISRINLAFHNSCYQYSKSFLYFLYFVVIAFMGIFGVLDILYVKGELSDGDNKDFQPAKLCYAIFPPWLTFAALGFDVVFTVSCSYLFIAPLIKIVRTMNYLEEEDQHRDQSQLYGSKSLKSMKGVVAKEDSVPTMNEDEYDCGVSRVSVVDQKTVDLVVKYTNVTTICMLSTIIGLGMLSIKEMTLCLTVDNGFVAFSVVLMCNYYQGLYYKLLGCCHKGWMKCCIQCCLNQRKRNKLLLQRHQH